MTSSRQRRSPKNTSTDDGFVSGSGSGSNSGSNSLTVQTGSQESLDQHQQQHQHQQQQQHQQQHQQQQQQPRRLRRKPRNTFTYRSLTATARRVRFCFLVSVGTFLCVACLLLSEEKHHHPNGTMTAAAAAAARPRKQHYEHDYRHTHESDQTHRSPLPKRNNDQAAGSTVAVGSHSSVREGTDTDIALSPVTFERFSADSSPVCTAPLQAADVRYTLVTQCSYDRLWMMEQHCARWGTSSAGTTGSLGPAISMAVWTNETADHIREELTAMGCHPLSVSVQTLPLPVPDTDSDSDTASSSEQTLADYPVNVLRNMALSQVQTSHVAYVDVDFWESTDLHANLMLPHVRQQLAREGPKAALVIPAFMLRRQCRRDVPYNHDCPEANIPLMPHHKMDLMDLFRHKDATQFDPSNRGGHGSTRYKDWMDQTATDALLPISCVLSNRYEPYVVVRYCRDLPPFQPAFYGYGKNKMTWIMQLVRSGYRFWQLGESFLIHYPHVSSAARSQWNGGPHGEQLSKPEPTTVVDSGSDHELSTTTNSNVNLLHYKRAQTDRTFIQFRDWLSAEIPDETRIPKCDDAMDDDAKLWIPRIAANEDDDEDDGTDDGTVDDEYEYDDVTDEETDDEQVAGEEESSVYNNGDDRETEI
jgi:hypothetical protein